MNCIVAPSTDRVRMYCEKYSSNAASTQFPSAAIAAFAVPTTVSSLAIPIIDAALVPVFVMNESTSNGRPWLPRSGANADHLHDFVCRQIDPASVKPDIS